MGSTKNKHIEHKISFKSKSVNMFSQNILGKKFSSNQLVYFLKIYWKHRNLVCRRQYLNLVWSSPAIISSSFRGRR
jgi:hypothetical protein